MPVFHLDRRLVFPPPELAEPDGLLALGGDLSPQRLLLAYSMGIFPWYSEGEPILWWSPDPRMVLFPAEFHLSRRLARKMRGKRFSFSIDQDFAGVIRGCATAKGRQAEGTWLNKEMIDAYEQLHRLGFARSVECWQDGVLAGGIYGVAMGRVFFGESMFSRQPDSSKAALAWFVVRCKEWGYQIIDCQVPNSHLQSLGARMISGDEFREFLDDACLPN